MISFIIYGLGISGLSTAKFLAKNFTNKNIIITDDNNDKLIDQNLIDLFQSFKNIKIINSDLIDQQPIDSNTVIIFSPGIPLYFPKRHRILDIQKKFNAKLICDLELFYLLNPSNKFIGITGTNGKSTTTALVNFILKNLSLPSDLGGNIGLPCFDNQIKTNHHFVFETSSYQLDLMYQTKFHIANLINITPDHIDRHGNIENYINSKKRIFNNQNSDDFSIINIDNQNTKKIYLELNNNPNFSSKIIAISNQQIPKNGVAIINNILHNNIENNNLNLNFDHQFLKGQHNQQNIAFAFASVYCLIKNHPQFIEHDSKQISQLILDQILQFKGLDHRMQLVSKINNINFINDSKATNAESTENALKTYKNIYWIVGGRPKEGGLSILKPYLKKIVKAYLIGESTESFANFFQQNKIDYEKCNELENAFNRSYSDAKMNSKNENNILLSPACASFDQWKNFEQRGNFFCDLVKNIKL